MPAGRPKGQSKKRRKEVYPELRRLAGAGCINSSLAAYVGGAIAQFEGIRAAEKAQVKQ